MNKEIKVGMKVKQIKEVGYPEFDRLGRQFEVKDANETIVMCNNGYMGFGISRNEFFEHFESIPEVARISIATDGTKTIRNGNVTVVILADGSKGVSKCMEQDTYDAQKGYEIAMTKALIKGLNKQLKVLCK